MKFYVVLGLLALAIVANAGVSMHNPFYCYITDPIRSMTNMHATASSYEAVRRFNFTTTNPYISTCESTRAWYLGRYGGRFPHPDLMQRMIDLAESSVQQDIVNNYAAGRTSLCIEDFEAIRNWTMGADFVIENASTATESGEVAMQNIAWRFQQHYPHIFPAVYERDHYLFRHTQSQRTHNSARAFATGLFRGGAGDVVYEEIPERDTLLRPFDFCPAFNEEVANWSAQRDALRDGPEIREMVEQVNRRLGFTGLTQLSFNTVQTMWEWCRFLTGSTFEISFSPIGDDVAWCVPFSVAHHLLFEYYEDLGHFYFSGYGVRNQRLLENLNCELMQDLLNHITSEDDNDPKARIFVSYTQELQLMLVAFSTFRDTWPIHQHNYAQQSGRNWLTSLISPLGGNLAVVRHDCDGGDHDLIFLLNERPILLPGCDRQTGVCKLNAFVERFQRFIGANCEELFCTNN